MTNREELIKLIREHTMIVDDTRIFTWIRCGGRHKLLGEFNLGGGNFLVILGIFSVFNFLSKIYYILHEDAKIWTEKEVKRIKEDIKEHKLTGKVFPPFVGSPKKSEKDCFIKFALEYPLFSDCKELSASKQKELYGRFWNSYRNKLAHMASSGGKVIAIDFGNKPYEDVLKLLNQSTNTVFEIKDNNYAVYSDLLSRDINRWISWLNKQILDPTKFSEERVMATLEWIKKS